MTLENNGRLREESVTHMDERVKEGGGGVNTPFVYLVTHSV
jgi:hypothetical protein